MQISNIFATISHLFRMIKLLFRAELMHDLKDNYELSYLMSLLYVTLFDKALKMNLAQARDLIEANNTKNAYTNSFTIFRLMDSCLVIQTDMLYDETYGEERDRRIEIIADFVQAVDVYLQGRTHAEVFLHKEAEGSNDRK